MVSTGVVEGRILIFLFVTGSISFEAVLFGSTYVALVFWSWKLPSHETMKFG